jgi:hypothetical protein
MRRQLGKARATHHSAPADLDGHANLKAQPAGAMQHSIHAVFHPKVRPKPDTFSSYQLRLTGWGSYLAASQSCCMIGTARLPGPAWLAPSSILQLTKSKLESYL